MRLSLDGQGRQLFYNEIWEGDTERFSFVYSFKLSFFHSVLLSTRHWLDTGGSSLQRATNAMAFTSHPVGLQQN